MSTGRDLQVLDGDVSPAVREVVLDAWRSSTREAYARDVRLWHDHCQQRGLDPVADLVPVRICEWLVEQSASRGVATLRRRVASLSVWARTLHRLDQVRSPLVRETLRGLANRSTTPPRRARPLTAHQLRRALQLLASDERRSPRADEQARLRRDAAVLAVGWVTGLRRSELAALRWGDVRAVELGLEVTVRRDKTSSTGRVVVIPRADGYLCPVRLLEAWRGDVTDASTSVFGLSDRSIDRVVRTVAERLRLGPGYSAHSLRAGYVSAAAEAGVPEYEIALQSGHRSVAVLRGYIREQDRWKPTGTRAVVRALER